MEQHLSCLVIMVPCSLILLASLLLTSATKQKGRTNKLKRNAGNKTGIGNGNRDNGPSTKSKDQIH